MSLAAHGGSDGTDLLAFFDRVREADPEEPFWRGVRSLSSSDDHVEIEWFEPIEPRLLPAGAVQVECHLYDEEALQEAERRTAEHAPLKS